MYLDGVLALAELPDGDVSAGHDRVARYGAARPPEHVAPLLRNTKLLTPQQELYHRRIFSGALELYTAHIHDANVAGASCVIKGGKLFYDGLRSAHVASVNPNVALNIPEEPLQLVGPNAYHFTGEIDKPERIDGSVFLLQNSHGDAWAFWHLDLLGRIWHWIRQGRPTNWRFLVSDQIPSYQVECYAQLGIDESRLIKRNMNQPVICSELIVGSSVVLGNRFFSREYFEVLQFIVEKIAESNKINLKNLREQRSRKALFISRADVKAHRPMLGADRIEAMLVAAGVDTVVPGRLSMADKLSAFYGYDLVIAELGSGVTNVALSGTGGKFLGLWPRSLRDPWILPFCGGLAREPWLLFCRNFEYPEQLQRNLYRSPFTLDLPEFRSVMAELGHTL